MSLAGSTARIRNVAERISGGTAKTVIPVTGLIFILVAWWLVILCWYLFFGLWLVPYRLFRRGQRKRDVAMLRHREFLAAMATARSGPHRPTPKRLTTATARVSAEYKSKLALVKQPQRKLQQEQGKVVS